MIFHIIIFSLFISKKQNPANRPIFREPSNTITGMNNGREKKVDTFVYIINFE
jgi:hypothetical protein